MSSIPIPSKGDIITIENKQYRVLKVTGNVVEIMAMYVANTQQVFSNILDVVKFTGGSRGASYKNSKLDSYLNETFFATLSTTIQAAIVPKTINQDMWDYKSTKPSSGTYYHSTYNSGNRYYFDNNSGISYGIAEIGTRKVYALSVNEIFEYLELSPKGTFADSDIQQMFWNGQTPTEAFWLRTAFHGNDRQAIFNHTSAPTIRSNNIDTSFSSRPAFQVDWDVLYPSTPTLTFKHFYDAGTIGSGTVKFRHYSQAVSNFTLSDGSTLITSDGQIFNVKEA